MTDFAFTDDVVRAVTTHMNDDHRTDNLVIVAANGAPDATSATLSDLGADGLVFTVDEPQGQRELTVAWPHPIASRPDIRHAVVALFDAAGGVRDAGHEGSH